MGSDNTTVSSASPAAFWRPKGGSLADFWGKLQLYSIGQRNHHKALIANPNSISRKAPIQQEGYTLELQYNVRLLKVMDWKSSNY